MVRSTTGIAVALVVFVLLFLWYFNITHDQISDISVVHEAQEISARLKSGGSLDKIMRMLETAATEHREQQLLARDIRLMLNKMNDAESPGVSESKQSKVVASTKSSGGLRYKPVFGRATDFRRTLCTDVPFDDLPPLPDLEFLHIRWKLLKDHLLDAAAWITEKYRGKNDNFRCRDVKAYFYDGALLHYDMTGLNGGPQGDLVHWIDIVFAMHLMGFDYHFQLTRLSAPPDVSDYDLYFIDYHTGRDLYNHGMSEVECKVRVLDVYGTQQWANESPSHGYYCCLNLPYLQQFWTDVPAQAPDNTFMGQFMNRPNQIPHQRGWQAFLMGKEARYFNKPHVQEAIRIMCEYTTVHAAVIEERNTKDILPDCVQNHGFMEAKKRFDLMANTSIFFGVGEPMIGVSMLEAMSNGMSVFNPRYIPALSRSSSRGRVDGFEIKPTSLGWTSQYPFLESAGVEPYVYTYNVHDPNDVRATIERAHEQWKRDPIRTGFLPEEFQPDRFFVRMFTLLSYQNFCDDSV